MVCSVCSSDGSDYLQPRWRIQPNSSNPHSCADKPEGRLIWMYRVTGRRVSGRDSLAHQKTRRSGCVFAQGPTPVWQARPEGCDRGPRACGGRRIQRALGACTRRLRPVPSSRPPAPAIRIASVPGSGTAWLLRRLMLSRKVERSSTFCEPGWLLKLRV